jgi:hypothetical protein
MDATIDCGDAAAFAFVTPTTVGGIALKDASWTEENTLTLRSVDTFGLGIEKVLSFTVAVNEAFAELSTVTGCAVSVNTFTAEGNVTPKRIDGPTAVNAAVCAGTLVVMFLTAVMFAV